MPCLSCCSGIRQQWRRETRSAPGPGSPPCPRPAGLMGGTSTAGAVLGSRGSEDRVQQNIPTALQAAEPGQEPAKARGITLGTKTARDWPEQSGQASRVRSGKKQNRQVWEKDSTSSELPPNILRAAWTGPSAARSPGRESLSWPSNPPWLPRESSKASGVGGRQSRAPPGSVCPASCHPSTALTRGQRRRVSPRAGGRAVAGWRGQCPACTPPLVGPADHRGYRGR